MKHFVGGFATGAFIGLGFLPAGEDKPLQTFMLAILAGAAAWGLLP